MSNTVTLHRVLAAKPDKVFRAFTHAEAFARWMPPNGYTASVDHLDAKVGGTFHMSFTNFTTGESQSFGGEYRELVLSEKISYTDVFDDPKFPCNMMTTITLKEVSCGTEVHIIQKGIPEAIPVEQCYLGWQQSLINLATLVEAETKD